MDLEAQLGHGATAQAADRRGDDSGVTCREAAVQQALGSRAVGARRLELVPARGGHARVEPVKVRARAQHARVGREYVGGGGRISKVRCVSKVQVQRVQGGLRAALRRAGDARVAGKAHIAALRGIAEDRRRLGPVVERVVCEVASPRIAIDDRFGACGLVALVALGRGLAGRKRALRAVLALLAEEVKLRLEGAPPTLPTGGAMAHERTRRSGGMPRACARAASNAEGSAFKRRAVHAPRCTRCLHDDIPHCSQAADTAARAMAVAAMVAGRLEAAKERAKVAAAAMGALVGATAGTTVGSVEAAGAAAARGAAVIMAEVVEGRVAVRRLSRAGPSWAAWMRICSWPRAARGTPCRHQVQCELTSCHVCASFAQIAICPNLHTRSGCVCYGPVLS